MWHNRFSKAETAQSHLDHYCKGDTGVFEVEPINSDLLLCVKESDETTLKNKLLNGISRQNMNATGKLYVLNVSLKQ